MKGKKQATQVKQEILQDTSMEWRINTPAFLKEVFENYPGQGGVFYQPANIFRLTLEKVAERASELNDPVMNALMCRLALYGIADPYDKENYNHDTLMEVMSHPEYIKWKENK